MHIYSDANQIVLQLRHLAPTDERLLETSFKAAVALTAIEAMAIASELLNAAVPQLITQKANAEAKAETDEPK